MIDKDGLQEIDGTGDLLTYLHDKRIPLVIASSNNLDDIKSSMSSLNFLHYFSALASGQ
ncbi:HAD hydrolase-like protein [Eremococcus coleocola]|uniref:HAD hydrolase-like protein n=1 Tax=Eremococcus coleocola TaxID=88132 RepID=UPI00115EE841